MQSKSFSLKLNHKIKPFKKSIRVDSDKSLSIRSFLIGSISQNISSVTNIGSSVIDALFGNGSYCESQMGADELSMTYRIIGSATYNNINNTRWSMSPNFAWAHDFYGYGPSSLGGFVPDKQSLSLGLNFDKGDGLTVGFNYVMQLGDLENNMSEDRDFVSANLSYAF